MPSAESRTGAGSERLLDEHNYTFEGQKAEYEQGKNHGILEHLKREAQVFAVAGEQKQDEAGRRGEHHEDCGHS